MGFLFSKIAELFSGKKLEICMVGLENSGKTTILNVLSMGYPIETLPTVGYNVKSLKKEGITMKVWDLGGQQMFRELWPRYTANADVILFVVDSSDFDRVPQAKKELHQLLDEKNLKGIPLLVVLNKIDQEQKFTKSEIVKHLNLDYITENPWAVVPCSGLKGTNIEEVVQWLITEANKK